VFKIVHAAFIAPGIKRFVIEAPRIARKQKPGQFIILRLYKQGERIPLTIERSEKWRPARASRLSSGGLDSVR
jgi:ferredoxin/flavodoxin---NADP+ reductase